LCSLFRTDQLDGQELPGAVTRCEEALGECNKDIGEVQTFGFSLDLHCQLHSGIKEICHLSKILFNETPRSKSRRS